MTGVGLTDRVVETVAGADPVAVAAVALVTTLVVVRLYAGASLLDLRFLSFWSIARRLFMPVLDKVGKRVVGVGAENRAVREEFVADVEATPREVATALQTESDREFEVSVLSGLKTDWDGNTEVASVVTYAGATPTPAAPDWLRADQIHVFMFRAGDRTRVAAHYEANSWRPDRWKDHLRKGATFDAAKGVARVSTLLDESGLVRAYPADARPENVPDDTDA